MLLRENKMKKNLTVKELKELERDFDLKIKPLQLEFYKLRDKRAEIKEELTRRSRLKFVGRAYKADNSYGSGSSWDIYGIVTGVTSYGLKVLNFEKTEYGNIEIEEVDSSYFETHFPEKEIPIEKAQKKLKKFVDEIYGKERLK